MVKTDLFHEIAGCRICRSRDLVPVIDLGRQALTGRFPAKTEPDPPSAPLVVVRCTHCGLVQLRYSVDTGELFAQDYGYRSGINATMRNHLAGIAARVAARSNLKNGDAVLDIGCNDGTLLTAYAEPGLFRVGIDPLAEMFRPGYPAGLEVHTGFFTAGTYISASGRPTARAITSIAMSTTSRIRARSSPTLPPSSRLTESGCWSRAICRACSSRTPSIPSAMSISSTIRWRRSIGSHEHMACASSTSASTASTEAAFRFGCA